MSKNYLSIPNSELAPLIAALPAPPQPGGQVDITALRAHLKNTFTNVARKNLGPLLPPGKYPSSSKSPSAAADMHAEDVYHVEEYTIPRDGGEIAIRTYRPAAEEDRTFPAMLAVHGGGTFASCLSIAWANSIPVSPTRIHAWRSRYGRLLPTHHLCGCSNFYR